MSSEGIELLGGAIGCEAFVSRHLEKVLNKQQVKVEHLKAFSQQNRQAASLLLRYCAVPRFTYWLRLIPNAAGTTGQAAHERDASIFDAAETIHGLPEHLPDTAPTAWRQLCLPVSEGGFGVTSAGTVRPAAYLGSLASTLPFVWQHFQDAPWMPENGKAGLLALPWIQAGERSRTELLANLPKSAVPKLTSLLDGKVKTDGGVKCRLQKELSRKLLHQEAQDLLAACEPEDRAAGRLRSCSGPGAGAWLTTVPCHAGLRLDNTTFTIASLIRLGLPLPPALTEAPCVCGAEIDVYGDHLLCCKHGGERHFRHDVLVEEFRRILREVRLPAQSEVLLRHLRVTPQGVDSDQKRMDLYWVDGGVGQLGDVTVTHPSRAPNSTASKQLNRAHGRQNGVAAEAAAKQKRSKYERAARTAGHRFFPLAVETYGRWGEDAVKLLRGLAKRVPTPDFLDESERDDHQETNCERWWSRLSVLLQKGNVQLIERRAGRAVEAIEQGPAPFLQAELVERGPFRPDV